MVGVPATSVGPAFCIDASEVTNADYARFLEAGDTGVAQGPPGKCTWNTDLTHVVPVTAGYTLPVLGVNWCDAYAYCAWAGKRLCGKVGGGPVDPGSRDTVSDQWMAACSQAGARVYPYGGSFDMTACAYCDADAGCDQSSTSPKGVASPVEAFPTCVGGYGGLFDMSGNAAEWEDSCADTPATDGGPGDPRQDVCIPRGGSFLDPHSKVLASNCLACASIACHSENQVRSDQPDDTGFRCCSDQ
jgi:formylglycine-generating enzyme required for sulfatase activity